MTGTLPRRVLSLAAALFLLAAVAFGLVELFQSRLVYMPDRVIHATPADIGLRYHDVRFMTTDGVSLDGWFVPAHGHVVTILVCHGNAGNISTRLDALRALHSIGASVFLFDYRGYGQSGGRPSEEGTYLDADAAWRWLVDHPEVTGGAPIVVMGRSLGGAIAAHLARDHPVAALILEAAFPSVRRLVAARVPFPPIAFLARYRYDTAASLRHVSCPVLIAHSPSDTVVPYALGRELAAAARPPAEFFRLRGPHDSGFRADGPRYTAAIVAFLHAEAGIAFPAN